MHEVVLETIVICECVVENMAILEIEYNKHVIY